MGNGHALVQAMLYGQLDGLGEETLFLFARTGLVHLFSASGFHLWAAVLVAGQAARLGHPWVRPGRAREGWDFALKLGLMVFFGQATEWSSPMVRAFVFASLLSGARLLETRPNAHWVFLLSLVASAALGRGSTLSFLLSACGMAGVLYIQPRKAWAIALGPWLFTLPITIWCFGLFPLLSPVWNVTFGLAISWLVLPPAILSLVLGELGLPTTWLDTAAAALMERLTAWLAACADFAGLAFWVRPVPWLGLVGGLYAAWFLWKKRRREACGVALAAFLGARFFPQPDLSLLDVGQGDALLLKTGGAWALSDAGPPARAFSAPVARGLEAYGVGELGEIALSHLDRDHSGGLGSLLTRHPLRGHLWIRESALGEKNARAVLLAAERAGARVRFLGAGSAPPGWECWLPSSPLGNESSPLCRARTDGGRAVLLTGDMGMESEAWFLSALREFPRAELLKVAHHGSRYSSSEAFLRASGAKRALVSAGRRNRYGHPSPEALARLEASGMEVKRTDLEGAVSFYSWPWGAAVSWAGSGSWLGSVSPEIFGFTEEIKRAVGASAREKPGTPALTSQVYAAPARVK